MSKRGHKSKAREPHLSVVRTELIHTDREDYYEEHTRWSGCRLPSLVIPCLTRFDAVVDGGKFGI